MTTANIKTVSKIPLVLKKVAITSNCRKKQFKPVFSVQIFSFSKYTSCATVKFLPNPIGVPDTDLAPTEPVQWGFPDVSPWSKDLPRFFSG